MISIWSRAVCARKYEIVLRQVSYVRGVTMMTERAGVEFSFIGNSYGLRAHCAIS
jgi:hypothetical protein